MGQIFNRRRATRGRQTIPYGAVDLGLPSGLLWAQGNIVKDANGNYSMGSPTDFGCYFSWGNIDGHNYEDGYDFGTSRSDVYVNTPGYSVTTDIGSNDALHDAAFANLGSPWHLPTQEDFQELCDNTDSEWTTIDGVKGYKFMKKTDHSIFIFLHTGGYARGTSVLGRTTSGYYWSSTWYSNLNAVRLLFKVDELSVSKTTLRYIGVLIRPVCSPNT